MINSHRVLLNAPLSQKSRGLVGSCLSEAPQGRLEPTAKRLLTFGRCDYALTCSLAMRNFSLANDMPSGKRKGRDF